MSSIKISKSGIDLEAHINNIQNAFENRKFIRNAMHRAGKMIVKDVIEEMKKPKHGRRTTFLIPIKSGKNAGKFRKVPGIRSAPWEAPSIEKGDLANSADSLVSGQDLIVGYKAEGEVAIYAPVMEFGSKNGKILPRPAFKNAINKLKGQIQDILISEFKVG